MLIASSPSLVTVWYARFSQAEPDPCRRDHRVPRVALPDLGVTAVRETYPVSSEDITPRSLLLPTHSPIPSGSPLLRLPPRSRSLCRLRPAPAASGIFPTLSLRILPQMPEPIPRRVPLSALAWFLLSVIGLPHETVGSASRFVPRTRFSTASFRGFSYFVMFRPPSLLVSQIVPTAAAIAARQPRRLRPSRTCVVTFSCIGYTIRPL